MLTTLTKSALRWMEEHRRRAAARTQARGDHAFAEVAFNRGDADAVLGDRVFEGALDVAYRDSARMSATYAVH